MKLVKDTDNKIIETSEVTDKEAEQAFKTILTWLASIILPSLSFTNFIAPFYTVIT